MVSANRSPLNGEGNGVPKRTATHATDKSSATVRKPPSAARASRHQAEQVNAADALARAKALPAPELSASDILALQRTAGNRAVQQILAARPQRRAHSPLPVQAKLVVGPAADSYERKADRVAATVMQASEPAVPHIQRQLSQDEDQEEAIQAKPLGSSITPLVQRQAIPANEEEENLIQHRAAGGAPSVEPALEHGISRARGGGQPLPGDVRNRMEQSFGADFSNVRVHTDGESDSLNRSLQSRAFTTGQDLFFKGGEYNPASRQGRKLIAHELTHVVQQSGGVTRGSGLSVQRAPSNIIQRSLAAAIMEDRKSWKMMSPKLKAAMVVAAPVLQPFAQAWDTGKAVATPVYKFLAGDNPGIIRAFLSGLVATPGALVGSVLGLAWGALRGTAFGIGNPLYSIGKRAVRFSPSEARGIYDVKPSHPKYKSEENEQKVNYNYDTKTDLANYALLIGGTGTAVGKFIADKSNVIAEVGRASSFEDFFSKSWDVIKGSTAQASETGKVLSHLGAAASGVGALASLMDAKKGFGEWTEKASTSRQQRIGLGKGVGSTLSAAQQSATSAYHIGNLTNSGVAATAQVATGGLALASGAVDVLRGGYSFFKARQNIERLKRLNENEELQMDTRKAAAQAATTQEMRKTSALGTVAKGVLTAVGGGLLAFSAATPVGWLLLAGGALLGGIFAINRWLDKRERKKRIAIRELGIEEERKEWEADVAQVKKDHWFWSTTGKAKRAALGPDPLERELKKHGFKDVGHFYSNYINYMANHLYNKAKAERTSLMRHVSREIAQRRGGNRSFVTVPKEITDARSKSDLEKSLKKELVFAPEGNHFLEIAELVESMGLRFDFQAEPVQPTPDKIGKALDA